MIDQVLADGTRCALHPEDLAVITCDRCGSFACDDCRRETKLGRLLCVTCYRRYLQTRKDHFDDESRVRNQALAFYILALLAAFGAPTSAGLARSPALGIALVVAFACLSIAFVIAGHGVATVDPRRRRLAIGLACVALLGFPIGTGLGALILVAFLRAKANYVLSPEYREVLDAVPDGSAEGRVRRWLFGAAVASLLYFAFRYLASR